MYTRRVRYCAPVEFAKLETASLADVDEGYYYGASCRNCNHSARLDLLKLRAHVGDTFPLVQIRKRLRCERCGSRLVTIIFLAPNQKTGNIAYLFGQTPRE